VEHGPRRGYHDRRPGRRLRRRPARHRQQGRRNLRRRERRHRRGGHPGRLGHRPRHRHEQRGRGEHRQLRRHRRCCAVGPSAAGQGGGRPGRPRLRLLGCRYPLGCGQRREGHQHELRRTRRRSGRGRRRRLRPQQGRRGRRLRGQQLPQHRELPGRLARRHLRRSHQPLGHHADDLGHRRVLGRRRRTRRVGGGRAPDLRRRRRRGRRLLAMGRHVVLRPAGRRHGRGPPLAPARSASHHDREGDHQHDEADHEAQRTCRLWAMASCSSRTR